MRISAGSLISGLATLVAALPVVAVEDAGGAAPQFKEGDVITLEQVDKLKPFLPEEFWDNRDFFFYEGMKLEVGPFHRDYTPAEAYQAASAKFAGQAKIGPGDSLENHTAGQPFTMDKIDCKGDPEAGTKVIWDFDYQWEGDGSNSRYYYSYWDRGEELPLFYEGTAKTILMSHRVEPEYLDKQDGDLFRGEKRKSAFGIEVDAPFDARGIMVMTYRYKDADNPKAT